MATPMLRYREITPLDVISGIVLLFWEFRADETDAPILHEVIPDGCISVIYNRNTLQGTERFVTAGIRTKVLKVPLRPGDVYWGARIHPSACSAFLGSDPRSLSPSSMGLPERFEVCTAELMKRLSEAQTLEEATSEFSTAFLRAGINVRDIDQKIAEATGMIERSGGNDSDH